MDITTLENNKKEGKSIFILKKSTPAFANAVRKYVYDKVPTIAIENVEIRKNGSAIYDEMVAHRLGLVPLTTDLKTYELPEGYDADQANAKNSVALTLSVKGPATVYSGDLKSKDPKVKPAFDKIPITKLLKGQDLELEATAFMGQGKEHVKWSPGHVHYKYLPELKIEGSVENPEEIVEASPLNIFEVKGGKLVVDKDKVIHYDLGKELESLSPKIKFSEDETQLLFYVESYGQLTCKEMIETAMDKFTEDLNTFSDALKKAV